MNAIHPLKADLRVARVLAELLERLERSAEPANADQYRCVVLRLADELGGLESGAALGVLLDKYPAAAELYENVNYRDAGLCRSALDVAFAAEQEAKEALQKACKPSTLN